MKVATLRKSLFVVLLAIGISWIIRDVSVRAPSQRVSDSVSQSQQGTPNRTNVANQPTAGDTGGHSHDDHVAHNGPLRVSSPDRDWLGLARSSGARVTDGYPSVVSASFSLNTFRRLPKRGSTLVVRLSDTTEVKGKVVTSFSGPDHYAIGLKIDGAGQDTSLHLEFDRERNFLRGQIDSPKSRLSYLLEPAQKGKIRISGIEHETLQPDDTGLRPDTSQDQVSATEGVGGGGSSAPPSGGPMVLESLPGAPAVIFLDIDGHTTSGTNWNSRYTSGADFYLPAWGAGDDVVTETWRRVSELYSPFAINVTTSEAVFLAAPANQRIRIVIASASPSWSATSGGIAYLGSFSWGTNTPGFVFANNLAPGYSGHANYVAQACAHEAGHSLNLVHDGYGTYGTSNYQEYYTGHGNWAPVMGSSYNKAVVQFSRGEYNGATNLLWNGTQWVVGALQDDFSVIDLVAGVNLRSDQAGNTIQTATPLQLNSGVLSGSARIEALGDTDVFSFSITSAGTLSGSVVSSIQNFGQLSTNAAILNSSGAVVAWGTLGNLLDANFSGISLQPGQYYLAITGGSYDTSPSTGFSNYGSRGTATFVLTFTANTPPPTSTAIATSTFTPTSTPTATNTPLPQPTATTAPTNTSAPTSTPVPTPQATATSTPTGTPATGSATYVGSERTTGGGWRGTYGTSGYQIAGGATKLPSYAMLSFVGNDYWPWKDPCTDDTRCLFKSDQGTERVAATWYKNTTFEMNFAFTDGQEHKVTLSFLDWDRQTRNGKVEVLPLVGNTVLDTRSVTNYQEGFFISWNIKGGVRFRFTNEGPHNITLTGVFVDDASSTGSTSSTSASFIESDRASGGNWVGKYGSQGYQIAGVPSQLQNFTLLSILGNDFWTWEGSTSETRALRKSPTTSDRIAATWYKNTSFEMQLALADGQKHKVTLSFLDWDRQSRIGRVQVFDLNDNTLLDTRTVSDYAEGLFMSWEIRGAVKFIFTNLGPQNITLTGVFVDGTSNTAPSPSASFVGSDSTTRGNWVGTYGKQGYTIASGTSSLPAYSQLDFIGNRFWTWQSPSIEPRCLYTSPAANQRVAATWYHELAFDMNLALTDGQAHKVTLSFLDWDPQNRFGRIDVLDPWRNNAVIDSRSLSNYQQGLYLSWNISGTVRFRFTNLGPHNITLNGVFIDPAA